MSQLDVLVQQAVAALKANKRDEARRILEHVVEQDERHEQGWLWLSGCVETADEQIICLQNVLTVNPNNQKARKGLEALQKPKAGGKPAAGASGTPTSVEWAGGATPALGSGKNVQLPTDEEYDSWLSGLRLGGAAGDGGVFTGGFSPSAGPFSAAPADPYSSPVDPYAAPTDQGGGVAPDYDVYNYDAYSYNYDADQSGNTTSGVDAYGSGGYGDTSYGNNAPGYDIPAYEPPKPATPSPFDSYDLSGFNTYGNAGQSSAPPPAAPGFQESSTGFDAGYGGYPATNSYASDQTDSGGTDPYGTEGGNYDLNSGYSNYDAAPAATPAPAPRAKFGVPAAPVQQDGGLHFDDEPYDPNYDPTQFDALPAGAAMSAPTAGADLRFKVIPDEIQIGSRGGGSLSGLIPVLVLAALNAVSIILLILNLTGG